MNTPGVKQFARRFFAEDLKSALLMLRHLNGLEVKGTLSYAGNHLRDLEEITAATESAIDGLKRIHTERLDSNISIKLTCLGLDIDKELCRINVKRILQKAKDLGTFVRIDMEESAYVDVTIELFEEMRNTYGPDTVGIVIQSYLRGRQADLDRLLAGNSRIRLVKGGYKESSHVVLTSPHDVKEAFKADIERLLVCGRLPAVATHDAEALLHAQNCARKAGRSKPEFEFQMLHGLQVRLRQQLVAEGHIMRCYIPYGKWWYTFVTPRFIIKGARMLMRHGISRRMI